MHIETEATRWLAWKAASQLEQGKDATKSAHHAHGYAAEQCMWIADEGVQVLGGHGYTREYPVDRMMRDGKITEIYEGTSEVQRIVIGMAISRD